MLRLMAITDRIRQDEGLDDMISRVQTAVKGGATSVQVRLKDEPDRIVVEVARKLVESVHVPVLVNDRFDIALASGAAGVHVGADDIPVSEIRRMTSKDFIVGASVGDLSEIPNSRDADFVGIGPVYSTPSKEDAGHAIGLDKLSELAIAVNKPVIAIGGITIDNASAVMHTGVAGIAVIGGLFHTPNPKIAARQLRSAIEVS